MGKSTLVTISSQSGRILRYSVILVLDTQPVKYNFSGTFKSQVTVCIRLDQNSMRNL